MKRRIPSIGNREQIASQSGALARAGRYHDAPQVVRSLGCVNSAAGEERRHVWRPL